MPERVHPGCSILFQPQFSTFLALSLNFLNLYSSAYSSKIFRSDFSCDQILYKNITRHFNSATELSKLLTYCFSPSFSSLHRNSPGPSPAKGGLELLAITAFISSHQDPYFQNMPFYFWAQIGSKSPLRWLNSNPEDGIHWLWWLLISLPFNLHFLMISSHVISTHYPGYRTKENILLHLICAPAELFLNRTDQEPSPSVQMSLILSWPQPKWS